MNMSNGVAVLLGVLGSIGGLFLVIASVYGYAKNRVEARCRTVLVEYAEHLAAHGASLNGGEPDVRGCLIKLEDRTGVPLQRAAP